MPKGPQGQKRPADAIGLAVMVGRIATGEMEDSGGDPSKAHHSAGGKKGGAATAAGITDRLWSLEDIVERIEARRPKSGPRGPYKKRAAA